MASEVTIDLSNYKDKIGQRVAPGRYRVVVEDAEQDTAKSGNEMINLWLRVTEGEFKGSVIIDRLVLTANSLFRVVGFMSAAGMPTPKKRLRVPVASFVGRTLEVEIEDGDPYNGRVKSEVRGYYRIAGASKDAEEFDLESLESSVDPDHNSDPTSGGNGSRSDDELLKRLAADDSEEFPEGAVDLETLEL